MRGLRRPPRGWLLPLCGARFLESLRLYLGRLHRLLVRGHHGLESSGRRRPLGARRGLDEHRRRIRPRRIELERIVRDGVLIAHRGWGWWRRRVVFPGLSRRRSDRRRGARGALFDRGLRRRTLRRAFRLLAFFGEPRERVEHARAAPAAHVTLRNAQLLARHQQSQGTLRTDRKHGLEPRPAGASMAASREAHPAVALAERSNIKARGISTCHVFDLVLHEPCQDDLPTGTQERREPRAQGTQRSRQDVREHHAGTLPDRKSTRLNSSHRCISYAVFCLKKKKKNNATTTNRHDLAYALEG